MKLYQALLPLAAAIAMAGCSGGRGQAQAVIGQAENVITQVRDEATMTAPAEFKAAETTLAEMKQNFDNREYQAVLDEVPQFNAQIETMKSAAETNQLAAAEWTVLNGEVSKSIEEIQARVESIKPNALPKNVTKDELETAKADLETMKATLNEASAAAEASKPQEALEKGRSLQAKAEELKTLLGMNEQLASAG